MTLCKSLAVSVVLVLVAGSSWAVTVNFYGESASQSIPLSGIAEITFSGNVLTIEVSNTSPVQVDPIYNPLLTGFGFWLPDDTVDADDILSWTATTGTGGDDVASAYSITDGGLPGMNYFTVVASGNADDGRIGNPAASFFGVSDPILDSVIFEFTFGPGDLDGLTDAWWFVEDPYSIALRFQSVGRGAEDSGVAVPPGRTPTPPPVVPEPGTVALVGLGLLSLAAARRKRTR